MELQVKITTEILDAIQHVCTRYRGRDVDTCKKVEDWVQETKAEREGTLIVKKLMEEWKEQEQKWLDQFKKGDIWKPKAWKCRKAFKIWCEYAPYDDPACDSCIHCGHPYERK